ncbi:tetratricopeptide repeat protein [Bacteroides xylanisolvens]|jgi:tetratricopeptide (TPR) repeat protein|uniref:Tetratricopeptide repeat protein n=1 Tax=Bacteroides xylanisolvens TaxID=371601 RepID=A0A1Y4VU57_9BACE|nr:tetratricopeptide repeat protein [Bacteroides xylanisolvens]MBV3841148.1 tetratricopeptide repeat protein [Bacteroides xylanisolvens]MCA4533884.1 tetratricopeptide repeat protein [Bacteroides xylanisolvens]MCA4551944.1 tetratricopeptide repeat protein [Bacteroides xylanisolvens]MCA4565686.1 tetratricopeptide repeat protein [Bacteroides xylanisolvens]MCA4570477.1 tetratricopeptide repeat protein [Bacteroides xylanisolvens]
MKTRCCCSKRYLLVFSILLVSVGSIFMSVSLSSCSSPSVKNPLLLCADSLMETCPDSALSILESITCPQKMPRADRALYALLLTQARHKNYIALEDDSLIKTAVDYYGDKKKSLRAAKAHYYWGATYSEMGYTSFAVEEYLTAIRLMPVRDEFLAMIYDNLAECYERDELFDIAIGAYRQAYQILRGGSQQIYPLRGIARMCLLQNKKDSALVYYQQALDCALVEQDSSLIGALYHDLAMAYSEKKDYIQADKYVSKAIMIQGQDAVNVCLSKAQIMLNLNKLDSASYFYSKNVDQLDIYGKAVYYDGMYQIAKKRGEWKTATENIDAYKILYDSIQFITDNEELNRLMDKHQLEEHKRLLSEHTKMLIFSLITAFFLLMIICVFCFMWNDRKRKKRFIALQRELTQKRVDTMLLKEEEASESNKEDLDKKRSELTEQQIQLCISVLKTTDCYDQLEALEKATPKQLLAMRSLRKDIRSTISSAFVDVMMNLKERYPALTGDDIFYCVLSLLCCSKTVMMELMDATSDALKTRKNRIKNKMDTQIFDRVFGVDIQ